MLKVIGEHTFCVRVLGMGVPRRACFLAAYGQKALVSRVVPQGEGKRVRFTYWSAYW